MVNISSDAQAVLNKAGTGAQQYVVNQGGFGSNLTSGEATRLLSGFTAQPNQGQVAQANMQNIASQEYKFDPNKFLPGIQQQATSIFAPQQAQLEAIRQLQSSQYQDASFQTNQDFNNQMQKEIESINNRGAFFSGGAVAREGEMGDAKLRALNQLGLQAQAADFNNLAQQGLLAAEESQFIQDRLYNAESGAYSRWSDQRNFSYQAAVQQYQIFASERDFARNVFESDRSYDLQSEQMDMQQKQFEQQYSIDSETFDMAKEKFQLDMQKSNLSYQQALENFKSSSALTNSGLFGTTNGNDNLDLMAGIFKMMGGNVSNNPSYPTNTSNVIDLDL